ncbi:hypothetical protein [Legionella geestiana]|nr:hypothetical protein [Legionella geestiana]
MMPAGGKAMAFVMRTSFFNLDETSKRTVEDSFRLWIKQHAVPMEPMKNGKPLPNEGIEQEALPAAVADEDEGDGAPQDNLAPKELHDDKPAHDSGLEEKPLIEETPPPYAFRQDIKHLLPWYESLLEQENPALYRLLPEARKKVRAERLKFTFYLLHLQYQIDTSEGRNQNLADYREKMWACARHVARLEGTQIPEEKPAVYMGFALGKFLADRIHELAEATGIQALDAIPNWFDAVTVTLRRWIANINERRLYWVWGSSLLFEIFEKLPLDYFYKLQMKKDLEQVSKVTGYMSFTLYYFRLAMELGLVFRHLIPGFWMSEEEKAIDPMERLLLQLDERKFGIMNDLLWAPANMACFFWLKGSDLRIRQANILTAGLLLFDTLMSIWELAEEEAKLLRQCVQYQQDILALQERYAASEDEDEQLELALAIAELQRALETRERDRKYNRLQLALKFAYAAQLTGAFCIMAFMAPLAGASLCLALNTLNEALTRLVNIYRAYEEAGIARAEAERQRALIFAHDTDDNAKRVAWLEMHQQLAEVEYQYALIQYRTIDLVYSTLVDLILPLALFAGTVYLPFGISIGVVVGILLLALAGSTLIKQLQPEREPHPEFDEEAFLQYLDNLTPAPVPALPAPDDVSLSDDEKTSLLPNAG